MKKLAINVFCAVAATLLAAPALATPFQTSFETVVNAQDNYIWVGNQSYDGLGVDSSINPYTFGSLPVTGATNDDYIGWHGTNGSLEIKSGTLTFDCDDFGVSHVDTTGENGTLTLDANTTVTVNVAGQYYPNIGLGADYGFVNVANGASLTFIAGGSVNQRWSLGESGGQGTMTINGGTVTVNLGTTAITDATGQLIIGSGGQSIGILNLNSGSFIDNMPLPVSLGGEFTGLSVGTLGSLTNFAGSFSGTETTPSVINISNGNFIVTGNYTPISTVSNLAYPNNEAIFNVGNGYINFIPGGTGALELTNWTYADFTNLVGAGQIRVAGNVSPISDFVCTTNNNMGIFKLGPLVVSGPVVSTPEYGYTTNDVLAGEAMSLIVSAYDPTATSLTYTWYSNNSQNQTFTLVPGVTTSNYVLNTTALYNAFLGPYEYYVVVADNNGNTITTGFVSVNSDLPASAPTIVNDISPNAQPDDVQIGSAFEYTVSFSGDLPITYQWQKSTTGIVFNNMIGQTNSTLLFPSFAAANNGYYRLVATNSIGTNISSVAYAVGTNLNEKIIWGSPIAIGPLTSDQILNSFASTDYVAAAMSCQPTPIVVTNGDGSKIVFGSLFSAVGLTGGNGYGPAAGCNTNAVGGNLTFSNMLNYNYYDANTHTISINNLVPGQQYIVQLFSLDDRYQYADNRGYVAAETVTWQDPTNANDVSQQYLEAPGDYIVGLLNASNSTEKIQENLQVGYGNFNAIVVRTEGPLPPPYFIAGSMTSIGNEYSGGNASFTAIAQEDANLPQPTITYQWISGPAGGPYTNIPATNPSHWAGTTTSNLTITNLQPADGNLTYGLVAMTASPSYGSATDFVTIGTITPAPAPPPTNIPPPANTLIGHWLAGPATYADQTGLYAGAHDAYDINATYTNALSTNGTLVWTNDVPATAPAGSQSLAFFNDGLFVTNSSTLDSAYASDYDTNISGGNGFTVAFWAKGSPGGWACWVSKYGDSGPTPYTGWQLREDGSTGEQYACWTLRSPGGTTTLGANPYGNSDDMATRSINSNDGQWHYYTGTYDPYTGVRSLYVDGVLAANETGNGAYLVGPQPHLAIGAKDQQPGDNFTGGFTGKIFDVRIYNFALDLPQLADVGRVPAKITVTTNAGHLQLAWPFGHLITATNINGPWVSNSAASPFVIIPNPANPQFYYAVQNP